MVTWGKQQQQVKSVYIVGPFDTFYPIFYTTKWSRFTLLTCLNWITYNRLNRNVYLTHVDRGIYFLWFSPAVIMLWWYLHIQIWEFSPLNKFVFNGLYFHRTSFFHPFFQLFLYRFREAAIFFVALRPYPLPLELSGHFFREFFSSFKKSYFFLEARPLFPLLFSGPQKITFFAATLINFAL